VKTLNDFIWHLAIPALLYKTMATQALPGAQELQLVGIYYGTAFLVYLAFMGVARFLFRSPPEERPILALSACFANGMMIGVPIIGGAYGEEGLRLLFLLLAIHSPFFVTTTTLLVETARNRQGSIGATLMRSAKSLARQTPIIFIALGLLSAAIGLRLPSPIYDAMDLLGHAVAPCGLIAVGASLANVRLQGHLLQSGVAAAVKLMILPAAVFLTTRLAGVPPLWSAVAITMAAIPTGVVAFNVALAFQIAPRRNASTIFFTNLAAIATLTFWLHVLAS
jgi:predicted permease